MIDGIVNKNGMSQTMTRDNRHFIWGYTDKLDI